MLSFFTVVQGAGADGDVEARTGKVKGDRLPIPRLAPVTRATRGLSPRCSAAIKIAVPSSGRGATLEVPHPTCCA